MTIFALVDCNNFYVSCERAFNPQLEGKPVVVLSNNDGCVISRSNEAKKLGIPMGAPFFKWEKFCKDHYVAVFSSNYELYGDMSQRVMTLLNEFCPDMEIYSIDEAFIQLDSMHHKNLNDYLIEVRQKIKMWTGIPVSIGFAPTKTLAKIANYIAKNHIEASVYDLMALQLQEKILAEFPVARIWGIGQQLAKRLEQLNIRTAKELRDSSPKRLRQRFSVVMEKMIEELRGNSCLPLETWQARKEIISSRSFGRLVTNLKELEEAISYHAVITSAKLRQQKSVAGTVGVFLQTNIFRKNDAQYNNGIVFPFPIPISDTRYIIRIAKKCIKHLYRTGYKYQKTGLILQDLMPNTIKQYDMFDKNNSKSEIIMKTVDKINNLYGKNTLFYGAEGIKSQWHAKFERRSSCYTTRWKDLLTAS